MHAFKERRDAFETQFAHQELLTFKARARASRKFGLWAAEQIGMDQDRARSYAAALQQAQVQGADIDSLFSQVRADFAASGLPHSQAWLRRQMAQLQAEAAEEIHQKG